MKGVLGFFDRLEDHIRGKLSHYPIWYAIIDSLGIVLLWRGIWVTTDYVMEVLIETQLGAPTATVTQAGIVWWDGPISIAIGVIILLMTGVFVSNFIGNEIIITGLRGDKKLTEKTEQEMRLEVGAIGDIRREVRHILDRIDTFEKTGGKGVSQK